IGRASCRERVALLRVSGVLKYSTCNGNKPKVCLSFLTIYKVSDTLHTRLSLSLASLSRLFCSPRKFLTLRQIVVALATVRNSGLLQCSVLVNCLSQPLKHFRLPAEDGIEITR